MLTISPSQLKGTLTLPPSKSHTMRAILLGALGTGITTIHSFLPSPDTTSMIEAMRAFGALINIKGEILEIEGLSGKLGACEQVIDAGNSGLVLRFIGGLAALSPTYTVITGDHSIRHNRPALPLLSALSQLGAFATSARLDGGAPIIIRGPIKAGHATLSGEDSQPVSALLIAASFLEGTTQLEVTSPGETPWIDLTLAWLRRLGGKVTHQDYGRYTITGPLRYSGFEVTIPGDLSSAAFPLVAALVTGSEITLENIDLHDVQGDKKIIEVLKKMGAQFIVDAHKKCVTVVPNAPLEGMAIDVSEMIDALPILAVMGCFASGKTHLFNGAIARKKESDRIQAIASELQKMGAQIEEREDGLIIHRSSLQGAHVGAHHDHRIAMALAVAGLGARGVTCVSGAECIAKSFPNFAMDFRRLGGHLKHE